MIEYVKLVDDGNEGQTLWYHGDGDLNELFKFFGIKEYVRDYDGFKDGTMFTTFQELAKRGVEIISVNSYTQRGVKIYNQYICKYDSEKDPEQHTEFFE